MERLRARPVARVGFAPRLSTLMPKSACSRYEHIHIFTFTFTLAVALFILLLQHLLAFGFIGVCRFSFSLSRLAGVAHEN